MINEQVSRWKTRAMALALGMSAVLDSREATREEVAVSRACFREHLDTLDELLLAAYADGRQDEREESSR